MNIKRVRKDAILPEYQTAGAAGFDFHACLNEPITIAPGDSAAIPTGVAVEIPAGFELQIRARSGMAFKNNVGLVNGVGTIDADFRGEMMVKLINFGKEDFVVEPGMRIAQGIVAKVERIEWEETDDLAETKRGEGGFGSTGNA